MKLVSFNLPSAGTGWEKIDGHLAWISSGDAGEVWGVNRDGYVYRRDGITASNPSGFGWTHINSGQQRFKQLDVYNGQVWAVTADGAIYYHNF